MAHALRGVGKRAGLPVADLSSISSHCEAAATRPVMIDVLRSAFDVGDDPADGRDDCFKSNDMRYREIKPRTGKAGKVLHVRIAANEHADAVRGTECVVNRRAQAREWHRLSELPASCEDAQICAFPTLPDR